MMKIKKTAGKLLLTTLILIATSNVSFATRYSLLVGVGDYPSSALEGPINDVKAMKKVLAEQWAFSPKNIEVLVDSQGTKANILKSLDNLFNKTNRGDEVFIYFSGHGTSARDRDLNFPLPTTSGAFIPYDIRDAKTIEQAVERLVIGKTDLKPVLTRFDLGGRQVFVAIDACYSGNAVRGVFKPKADQLPSRFLDLSRLFPSRKFGDDLVNNSDQVWEPRGNEEQAYPYKNIYYLSASGEHEQAKDIPTRLLDQKPTIDGVAHGAFTDTLLRVLKNPNLADINKDGAISYSEITQTVRKLMRRRGFDHTPNGLPSIAEDSTGLATRGLFRRVAKTTPAKPKPKPVQPKPATMVKLANVNPVNNASTKVSLVSQVPAKGTSTKQLTEKRITLKLEVEPGFSRVANMLSKLKGVKLVSKGGDLVLRKRGSEALFVSQAGDLVSTMSSPKDRELLDFVKHQAWIHQLINSEAPQDFNIAIDFYNSGRGSVAVKGEVVGFSVKSERDAYILLVDIDPKGDINVIYPFFENELKPIKANKTFSQPELTTVKYPYGRDFLQVYAFDQLTSELKQLMGAEKIGAKSPLSTVFKRLISNKNLKKARASIELVTVDRR